jgi:hypothetical protein
VRRQNGVSSCSIQAVSRLKLSSRDGPSRIVIISTVRQQMKFLEDDRRRDRGLLFEPRRLNVALTRSKELLVIVGNANTLVVSRVAPLKTVANFSGGGF